MKKLEKVITQIFIMLSMLIIIGPGIAVFVLNDDVLVELEKIFKGQLERAPFLGIGLLLTYVGVKILKKREVDIEYLNRREVMYTITGDKALAFGLVTLIMGIAALAWGGVVWVKVIWTIISGTVW